MGMETVDFSQFSVVRCEVELRQAVRDRDTFSAAAEDLQQGFWRQQRVDRSISMSGPRGGQEER
jgi:hypothetical protein